MFCDVLVIKINTCLLVCLFTVPVIMNYAVNASCKSQRWHLIPKIDITTIFGHSQVRYLERFSTASAYNGKNWEALSH